MVVVPAVPVAPIVLFALVALVVLVFAMLVAGGRTGGGLIRARRLALLLGLLRLGSGLGARLSLRLLSLRLLSLR